MRITEQKVSGKYCPSLNTVVPLTPNTLSTSNQQQNNLDPRKYLKVVEEIIILTLSNWAGPMVQKYRDVVMAKQDKQNPFPALRIHSYSF